MASIRDLIFGKRSDFDKVSKDIADAESERNAIADALPHEDDIVSWYLRGARATANYFVDRMAFHLQPEAIGALARDGYYSDAQLPERLLATPPVAPTRGEQPHPFPGGSVGPVFANVAALSYFLLPMIEERLPELVRAKLAANGYKGGMRAADRAATLAKIDAKLKTLNSRRDELQADLDAVAAAAMVNKPKPAPEPEYTKEDAHPSTAKIVTDGNVAMLAEGETGYVLTQRNAAAIASAKFPVIGGEG